MNFFKFFRQLIFLVGLLVVPFVGAVGASPAKSDSKAPSSKALVASVFESLQDSSLVTMKVKKKVSSPYLAKPKEASGTLNFSKGKIRMKIEAPYPSLLVLTGKDIWLEEKQPEEFGGGVQVSHFKAAQARKSSALLALLFGESKIWNELKLVGESTEDKSKVFNLVPIDQKRLEAKELRITLSDSNELKGVSYSDELDNVTEYSFSDIKKSKKAKPELFKYSPPKGAEIVNF